MIEPYDNGNAFMLAHPEELARTGWGNNIEVMIGATSFENGVLAPILLANPFFAEQFFDFPTWVPYPLNHTEEERNYYGEMLRLAYFGTVEPTPLSVENLILVRNI